MTFQSTVRIDQTTGIVGDVYISGPMEGKPGILQSTAATNNVIGRAFRHVANSDLEVSADVAAGAAFAGILANSKRYATSGTAAGGTLASTLTLPNEAEVELVSKTSGIIVQLSTDGAIGENVFFATATGILASDPGTTLAGHELIPNAVVVRMNIPAAGLAIIKLV